jgi:hypothetical protein
MSYKKSRKRRGQVSRQKIYHYFLDALVLLISKFLFPEKKEDPQPVVSTDHICEAGMDPDGWETICPVCKKRKAKTDRIEVVQKMIDEKRIYLK